MSLKELAPTYYTRLRAVLNEVGRPRRMLNAGCGDGAFDLHLKERVPEIISFDINEADIRLARTLNPEKRILYLVADMSHLPFASNTFDCVICIDVLEHLTDDTAAIRETCRCLSPGGKLIITTPSRDFPVFYDPLNYVLNRLGKRVKVGIWAWGHQRLYTLDEIVRKTGLYLTKSAYLSKSVVGLLENSYLTSVLQRFTKNDPSNTGRIGRHMKRTARTARYKVPFFLRRIRDGVVALDAELCRRSSRSIGIMAIFKK